MQNKHPSFKLAMFVTDVLLLLCFVFYIYTTLQQNADGTDLCI